MLVGDREPLAEPGQRVGGVERLGGLASRVGEPPDHCLPERVARIQVPEVVLAVEHHEHAASPAERAASAKRRDIAGGTISSSAP